VSSNSASYFPAPFFYNLSFMLICQALCYVQLIVFQGGGRFQSLTVVRDLKDQSALLCLLRFAHIQRLPFVSLCKTSRWATSSIPTKVKRYNQFKIAKQNLKASDLSEIFYFFPLNWLMIECYKKILKDLYLKVESSIILRCE